MSAAVVHLLLVPEEVAACGAPLPEHDALPQAEWPWSQHLEDVTCQACKDADDERRFDASLPDWIGDEEPEWSSRARGIAADDAAADRYIEDRLTGGDR
jgi:hypothetical protein